MAVLVIIIYLIQNSYRENLLCERHFDISSTLRTTGWDRWLLVWGESFIHHTSTEALGFVDCFKIAGKCLRQAGFGFCRV
jgi:hypothetical protein